MIINYTDLCEDTDRVDGFSIIINNDLSRLGKIEFQTHLNKFAIFQTDLRATKGPPVAHGQHVKYQRLKVWSNNYNGLIMVQRLQCYKNSAYIYSQDM